MHQLNADTHSFIEKIRNIEWFNKTGSRITAKVRCVKSWEEALAQCASPQWEAVQNTALSSCRLAVRSKSVDSFARWNDIVDSIKAEISSIITEKTQRTIEVNQLPKVFVDCVNWDILSICIEHEYSSLYPGGYYRQWAHWYLEGHFPCGWEGEFPDGRLIVF